MIFGIRRRLVRWTLLVVGLPLFALTLHRVADELEARRGASEAARRLHQAGSLVDRARRII
jgi:hypothetical protein